MLRFLLQLAFAGTLFWHGTLATAQQADISPNCLNYALSEKFDYLPDPLWMNRTLDPNEGRFLLNDDAARILTHFTDVLRANGKEVFFLPIPDTPQFAPQGEVLYGTTLERFEDLYHFLNAQMEDVGFTPIDLMWLAERNRSTKDLHRNLDHHLLSRGRYLAAAQIAHRLGGASTLAPIHQAENDYDDLAKEPFKVWKPTALNFAIDACKSEIEALPFDEYVALPALETAGNLDADSLFGDVEEQDKIALLGTSQSLSAKGNLADFIAHFTQTDVMNFAEAGGGASAAIQFAAAEGVLTNPSYEQLIWEVSTDFDSAKLAGAALAGLGHAEPNCQTDDSFDSLGIVSGQFGKWFGIPADLTGGYVLALPNVDHQKGVVSLRFEFSNQPPFQAEIWRWSQTQDPGQLGDWKIMIPNFEAIGMAQPTSIAASFDGLYEYSPKGSLALEPKICATNI